MVVLGVTRPGEVEDITDIWNEAKRDLRNVVDRRRRKSPSWEAVELALWLEVDAVDVQDIACLGSDKRRQVGELRAIPFDATGPVFIVTCHGVLFLGPEVTLDEAQGVFSSYWDRHNQVNVRIFHDNKEFYKNIGHVVNYPQKHNCHMEFSGGLFYQWYMK